MNKQEQRIIEAARQVLSDWLGGDLTADVGGDFYELESAIKDYEKPSPIDFDWQSFRAEAAKDILSNALIPYALKEFSEEIINTEYWADRAVEWADAIMKQLKEKEK